MGNCVLSLRLLSALDWNAFFERSSHVEAILAKTPRVSIIARSLPPAIAIAGWSSSLPGNHKQMRSKWRGKQSSWRREAAQGRAA